MTERLWEAEDFEVIPMCRGTKLLLTCDGEINSDWGVAAARALGWTTLVTAAQWFLEEAEMTNWLLQDRDAEGILPCNRTYQLSYEIIYAVEKPRWARTHKPETPEAIQKSTGVV